MGFFQRASLVLSANMNDLLDRVEQGERIVITKQGRPVARLVPAPSRDLTKVRGAIARLKAFSAGQSLGGLSWKSLRDEGRR